jgi:phosphonate degradation associated HDIG domain protein
MPPFKHSGDTNEIVEMLHERGDSQYGGESVTQLEHALQAAYFAEQEGASPFLITAALLHDVGHLLHSLPDDAPDRGVDDRHEDLAARWLQKRFGHEVVEPARLHVDAKRYLCAVEHDYFQSLSPPSVISLRLQGGPMTADEVEAFRANPFYREAIALRRWDDAAKVPAMKTPPLEHFAQYVEASLQHKRSEVSS